MGLIEKLYFQNSTFEGDTSSKLPWDLFALLFLILCFFTLEYMCPYYFTIDDNHVQFLPVILDFCHFLEKGIVSTYNHHQLLGFSPISVGVYALTYPVTHLSYFISKYFFGNELLTMEIFAFIHIISGYYAMRTLLLYEKVSFKISITGAICFVLSGYSIIAGRCWFYMLPQLFWTPLIFLSFLKLFKTSSLKWLIISGLSLGVSFHSGNAQMWIYNLIFLFILFCIKFSKSTSRIRFSLNFFSSITLGIAVTAPLFLLQYNLTKDLPRDVWGEGITHGILSMVFPFPIIKTHYPNYWVKQLPEQGGQVFYSGSIFSIIGLLTLLLLPIVPFKFKKKSLLTFLTNNYWYTCGVLAFIWGLGSYGLLWNILSYISPFNKFSNPFKFLHFINFFFILGGGIIIERYLFNKKNKEKIKLVLTCLVLSLIYYHITLLNVGFTFFPFTLYPNLNKSLHLKTQRRIAFIKNENNEWSEQTLPFNFSSYYQKVSFGGYDPITQKYQRQSTFVRPQETPQVFYHYGVEYLFLYKTQLNDELKASFFLVNHSNLVQVWKANKSSPLAFDVNTTPPIDLPINYTGKGMLIDISSVKANTDIVVNFCYYPNFKAYIDEIEVPVIYDLGYRMIVKLKKKSNVLNLVYEPEFKVGYFFSFIFLIFSFFFYQLSKTFK